MVLIPEHPSIHATNVIEIGHDRLLVVWFGGTREKHPDTAIWGAIYQSGEFAKPFRIAKVTQVAHWNPILAVDGDRIICYFKVGHDCSNWRTWFTVSLNGRNWSRPELLIAGDRSGRGPTKNKIITTSDGAWLAPGSNELFGWRTYIERSEDHGRTWQVSRPIDIRVSVGGVIQPAIWESTSGNIHALMRSSSGYLWRSDSGDYGRTWTEAYLTDIPNNNSGIDLIKLSSGLLSLVFNPIGKNWGPRTPLTLATSDNNGVTWYNKIDLESGYGEFSYPSITESHEGIAISYTINRKSIGLVLGGLSRTQSKILVH